MYHAGSLGRTTGILEAHFPNQAPPKFKASKMLLLEHMTWLAIIAPWVIGAFLAHELALANDTPPLSAIIMAMAGGVLSYIVFAQLAAWNMSAGRSSFTHESVTAMAACAALCLAFTMRHLPLSRFFLRTRRAQLIVLKKALGPSILMSALVGTTILMSGQTPTQGWDVLSYWAPFGHEFIIGNESPSVRSWSRHEVHPSTVSIISAWASWIGTQFDFSWALQLTWLVIWGSIATTILCHSMTVTNNGIIAWFSTYAFLSLALVSNHVGIPGYAELLIAALVVSSTAIASISLEEGNVSLLVTAAIIASGCIFIKNLGWAYSICVGAGVLISTLFLNLSSRKLGKILSTTILLAFLIGIAAIQSYEGKQVWIGNRLVTIDTWNLSGILKNEAFSLFFNQSFYQVGLLIFLSPFVLADIRGCAKSVGIVPWCVTLSLLAMVLGSQLTSYGFHHASPLNDTGNSRVSIVFVSCFALVAASLIKAAFDGPGKNCLLDQSKV